MLAEMMDPRTVLPQPQPRQSMASAANTEYTFEMRASTARTVPPGMELEPSVVLVNLKAAPKNLTKLKTQIRILRVLIVGLFLILVGLIVMVIIQ